MTNEKRLIDANRGDIDCIKSTNSNYALGFDNGLIDVMDRAGNIVCTFNAKDIPAADAVEVVHGRWNEINRMDTCLPWKYRCNECGCPQDYAHNYCPNCGAKMDGWNKDG